MSLMPGRERERERETGMEVSDSKPFPSFAFPESRSGAQAWSRAGENKPMPETQT